MTDNSSIPSVSARAQTESPLDLSPAQWIWIDAQRTLPNTVVLFRFDFQLTSDAIRATGHISADSRYRLWVNGERSQTGPAPCDPRVLEADPIELGPMLREGSNSLAVEVLYLGSGEGTYVLGRPGLLISLKVTTDRYEEFDIVTNSEWSCKVDRSRRPGQHRRWYLRGWQEETDLRLQSSDWATAKIDVSWRPATPLEVPANRPPMASEALDPLFDLSPPFRERAWLVERSIPSLNESIISRGSLVDQGVARWASSSPEDWFDFRIGQPPELTTWPLTQTATSHVSTIQIPPTEPGSSHFLTYRLERQLVGWPRIVVTAPAGTIIEIVTQESHDPTTTGWIDSHYYTWSRVIAPGGQFTHETFEFESLAWLQLSIRGHSEDVYIHEVSLRERKYAWAVNPSLKVGDHTLSRVIEAAMNTLSNSAQDAVVDGMGRERQQYSGDVSHQLHYVRRFFDDTMLPIRFLRTFSRGQTLAGYFFDCWPASDRLSRLPQRELGLTQWGPILDHSVGFVFDCWYHYWETGQSEDVVALLPRLTRFVDYLGGLLGDDGLLPVEELGIPSVWIDHDAFKEQRDKQCAFNLYVIGMLRIGYCGLAGLAGDPAAADRATALAENLLSNVVATFWCPRERVYVSNLPWSGDLRRYDDRSLAMAILFELCPDENTDTAERLLVEMPAEVGRSYPANAIWRSRALISLGRVDAAVDDLRDNWSKMSSIGHNGTLQEHWVAHPDSTDEWSHCAVAPLAVLSEGIIGLTASKPGYSSLRLRPHVRELGEIDVTAYVPQGPIRVVVSKDTPDRVTVHLPGVFVIDLVESGQIIAHEDTSRWGASEIVVELLAGI